MATINTTTPPLITNTFSGVSFFDFHNIRLEPAESELFRGFKIDDDIVLFLMRRLFQVVAIL